MRLLLAAVFATALLVTPARAEPVLCHEDTLVSPLGNEAPRSDWAGDRIDFTNAASASTVIVTSTAAFYRWDFQNTTDYYVWTVNASSCGARPRSAVFKPSRYRVVPFMANKLCVDTTISNTSLPLQVCRERL